MRLGLLLALEFLVVLVVLVGVATIVIPGIAPQAALPTPTEAGSSVQSCPRQVPGCR